MLPHLQQFVKFTPNIPSQVSGYELPTSGSMIDRSVNKKVYTCSIVLLSEGKTMLMVMKQS